MIENQEELRASQETIRALQDEIDVLKSQKAELEERPHSGSDPEGGLQSEQLQNQAGLQKDRFILQLCNVTPSQYLTR